MACAGLADDNNKYTTTSTTKTELELRYKERERERRGDTTWQEGEEGGEI